MSVSHAPPPVDPVTESIVAAVQAIVAQEGFEGATIRRVAKQAGCSAGAVQNRFPTRERLLRAAFDAVVAAERERMASTVAPAGTLAEGIKAATRETLPLDARRTEEMRVWTAFVVRAATEPLWREPLLALDRDVHEQLAAVLPGPAADAITALADGIALRLLYTPPAEHGPLLDALDVGIDAILDSYT